MYRVMSGVPGAGVALRFKRKEQVDSFFSNACSICYRRVLCSACFVHDYMRSSSSSVSLLLYYYCCLIATACDV